MFKQIFHCPHCRAMQVVEFRNKQTLQEYLDIIKQHWYKHPIPAQCDNCKKQYWIYWTGTFFKCATAEKVKEIMAKEQEGKQGMDRFIITIGTDNFLATDGFEQIDGSEAIKPFSSLKAAKDYIQKEYLNSSEKFNIYIFKQIAVATVGKGEINYG